MRSKAADALSKDLRNRLEKLGANIRLARTRRGMSLEDMAVRAHSSVATVRKLEMGNPTVNLAVLLQVLDVFGLADQLLLLANPSGDEVGLVEERRRQPKRVHTPKRLEDMF